MPTYYLWKNAAMSDEELDTQKNYYRALGFRVVTFQDGDTTLDINEGLRAIIKNHHLPDDFTIGG